MCPKGFFEDQFIGQFRALAKFAREFGYVEGQRPGKVPYGLL